MLFIIQTYTWLFLLGLIAVVFGIYYVTEIFKNLWHRRVDKFFRRIQTEEHFMEKLVTKAKKLPSGILNGVKWFFISLTLIVVGANIYMIQTIGQLLITFQQMVWLLAGLFQLATWPIVEAFYIFSAKIMGATTPEGPLNNQNIQLFYELSFSFVIGAIFWAIVPFDDWIKIKDENDGDEAEQVAAQSANRRTRNLVRLLGIIGLFLYLNLTGKFDRTMAPMWGNEGLNQIGLLMNHYGEKALVFESNQNLSSPVPYSTISIGGKTSPTGAGAVPSIQSPTDLSLTTANESGGGGGTWIFWLLGFLILLIAVFLFLWKKKPELLPKFGRKKQQVEGGEQPQLQEQYDWDAIYNELAKPEFNPNWRSNCDKVIGAAPETEKQRFINLRNEMVELYDASTDRQAGILDAYLKAGSIPDGEKTRTLRLINCLQATVLSSSPEGQIAASAKKTFFS